MCLPVSTIGIVSTLEDGQLVSGVDKKGHLRFSDIPKREFYAD